MSGLRVTEWRKLPMSLAELCLDTTLRCGQSFRWRKTRDDEWSCALHGRIITLKQDSTHLHFRTSWPALGELALPASKTSSEDTEILLRRYLNLGPDLATLYEQWSLADPNFKKKAPRFAGIRILKQDAWETLVGFICSSNNNIVRISQMVHKLCLNYGPLIGHIDDLAFHGFPTASALTGPGVEAHLRELGFGYRAKYIARTALIVVNERPEGWLQSLVNPADADVDIELAVLPDGGRPKYRKAHEELLRLQGVGPKVADCVCLMGLGWGEAVPVDTHVWQFAQRDYKFGKGKHKSLTKATYDAVGDYFRQLWGNEAGWAHSVLFAADLKTFAEKMKTEIVVDTELVKIKQEESSLVVATADVKRKLSALQGIKDESLEDEKVLAPQESPRAQRAKRRR
ncbi:8-oxoguanine DNA-glycosylase [Phlyctema vagabunda]|uniref:DNA-(apurinic or apyrimidinic site) lyase n=1 Tax=Phlyctema vagabunda TaxID=108571 RepID=A0ABR4PN80_9HELO